MRRSIRARLFLILALATGLVWAFASIWIGLSTRAELERGLDARLVEAARMVSSLIDSQGIDANIAVLDKALVPHPGDETPYERQLSCQIWTLAGSLVGRSDGAPVERLSGEPEGFSEREIDGETWRTYTVRNETLGVEVMVGDNLEIRRHIVTDLLIGVAIPMGVGLPILGGFLWLGAGRGLRPLADLAGGLEHRHADDLSGIEDRSVPAEIRPVVRALNGLFLRVGAAREHERQFLAFAAHELRTPLAGLKTQAEIAARASDEAMRRRALTRIDAAVDRTARLVTQLLAMGEAEASEARLEPAKGLDRLLCETLADQREALERRGGSLLITVEDDDAPAIDPVLLTLALRNLVENAVVHSPENGTVRVFTKNRSIVVEDGGPGLSNEERERAKDRFYRGANPKGAGSGLGLAIADLAVDRMGCELRLTSGPGTGLRCEIRKRRPDDPMPERGEG